MFSFAPLVHASDPEIETSGNFIVPEASCSASIRIHAAASAPDRPPPSRPMTIKLQRRAPKLEAGGVRVERLN